MNETEPTAAEIEAILRRQNALTKQNEALARQNAALVREAEQLRICCVATSEQFGVVRGALDAEKGFRLAALNLIEDAAEERGRSAAEAAQRQLAEQSLRRVEERLKAALSATRMATWDWDPETDRIKASDTIRQVYGLLPGENFESSALGFRLVHPDDVQRHRAIVEAAVREEHGWRSEFRIIRPCDGEIAWLEERAQSTRDPQTGRIGLAGIVWDITERQRAEQALRESEERMRLIVENAREYAIFSMDLQRRVTSWNSGAERILGYSEEEIVGQSGDIIFTKEDREAGACEREARIAFTEGRAADERWHARKDRTRFWSGGMMMAMHGPGGETIGFVKILRDQTAVKQAAEELNRSRAELEEAFREAERARREAEAASRTKDHFLAALSHELRTPLTPVLMAVEGLLPRQDLPERVRQALEMIHRNIQTETHFIDDLLDVTRIAHGKLQLTEEPLDVHESVQQAIEVSQADIQEKKQELTVELAAKQTQARGDIARLQQVFWNLLKNASKFTPNAGHIRVSSRNDGPQWIVVEVSDDGRGIEPQRLGDIFEAFQQEDTSVTRKFGGLGLGLAIAKATVEGHGGTIVATSGGRGKGSTFMVRLPLQNAN